MTTSSGRRPYEPKRTSSSLYILAYDVTDQASFNSLNQWREDILKYGSKVIIVGTKCDLESERAVPYEFANKYAENLGLQYIETSAKKGINVEELFLTAVDVLTNSGTSKTDKNESYLRQYTQDEELKQQLITRLKRYIHRIESHKDTFEKNRPNFTHGFWFFSESRAVNREANYHLAKQLLNKLERGDDTIENIFDDIIAQRNEVIGQNINHAHRKHIRGINSAELNSIIQDATENRRSTLLNSGSGV